MEMDKTGRYGFVAEPFHCDFSGRLFMGHMGNHLLNAADYHSHDRGFGMAYLNTINKTWVLSRLAVEMERMPAMYAHFDVETWVESAMRFFTNRNFKVIDSQSGEVYGYGRSVWAMIDTQTRQPVNLLEVNGGSIANYVERTKTCPIAKGSRVNCTDAGELVAEIKTRYNDIDINGHVNSVKYIEHVLDTFPVEWYQTHRLQRFEVAYVAEAHAGDTLRFYRESPDGLSFFLRVVKSDDTASGEMEICRSMARFVKD